MRDRRVLTLVVIAALLLGGAVADRAARSPAPGGVTLTAGGSPGAFSRNPASTWYCPGGTAAPGGRADVRVVIANPGAEAVAGVLTVFRADGEPVTVPLDVPARGSVVIRLQDSARSPNAGAVVELDAGRVAVEQVVSGPEGESASPCASGASSRWYWASGSTDRDNALHLMLLNPFPEDAIVDMAFSTEQGRTIPGPFTGVVVPGRSVLAVDVGAHVRRREDVAASVVARRGRLAAGVIRIRTAPRPGLAFTLAAAEPRQEWDFPHGELGPGAAERFHIYNPTGREASVEVTLNLDQGAAEPFELRIPPRERVTLDPGEDARVPEGVGHAAVVRSFNVGIVVERTLDVSGTRTGITVTRGAPAPARQWLFAEGAATDGVEQQMVVLNPGRRDVRVSVRVLRDGRLETVPGLDGIRVGAGRRHPFRLADHVTGPLLPLVVDASGPVVVERTLIRTDRPGISSTMGIPVIG